jgi:hypothetical protein
VTIFLFVHGKGIKIGATVELVTLVVFDLAFRLDIEAQCFILVFKIKA